MLTKKCQSLHPTGNFEYTILFDKTFGNTKALTLNFQSQLTGAKAIGTLTTNGEKMHTKKCQSLHLTGHFEYTILFDKTFGNTKA